MKIAKIPAPVWTMPRHWHEYPVHIYSTQRQCWRFPTANPQFTLYPRGDILHYHGRFQEFHGIYIRWNSPCLSLISHYYCSVKSGMNLENLGLVYITPSVTLAASHIGCVRPWRRTLHHAIWQLYVKPASQAGNLPLIRQIVLYAYVQSGRWHGTKALQVGLSCQPDLAQTTSIYDFKL